MKGFTFMACISMTNRVAVSNHSDVDMNSARKFMNDMAKEAGIETEGGAVPKLRWDDHSKLAVQVFVKNKTDADKLIRVMDKHSAHGEYDYGPNNTHWVTMDLLVKKQASITVRLDEIAGELEKAGNLKMALAIDKISDRLEGLDVVGDKWIGTPPSSCDACLGDLNNTFFDAKLKGHGWAIVCQECFNERGIGLGTGKGQQYRKKNNEWVKVKGTTQKKRNDIMNTRRLLGL